MIPKICTRCDQAVYPGEPFDTLIHHAANWAGQTFYSHKECPELPRLPAAPSLDQAAAPDAHL